MKAWNKRMIWFFGYLTYNLISDLVHYGILNKPMIEYPTGYAITFLGILLIPMLFFGDD